MYILKNQVFCIRVNGIQVWQVYIDGRIIPADFNSKGAAQAALDVETRRNKPLETMIDAVASNDFSKLDSETQDRQLALITPEENLIACDNCGAQSHQYQDCPYSFGANVQ